MEQRIVDTQTACQILGGIARSTLAKLRKEGKISPVPYHRGRWDVVALHKYLDEAGKSISREGIISDIIAKNLKELRGKV